jgi:apolipoprotein N-acyltransferase
MDMRRTHSDGVHEGSEIRGSTPTVGPYASVVPAASSVDRRAGRARAGLIAVGGTVATACAVAVYTRAAWPSVLIGWFCLVPWLVVLDRTTSLRGALAAGVLMSAAFVTAVFPWFPQMVASYTGLSWPAGAAALLLLAPALEPQFVTFALGRHLARHIPGGARPWLTALIGAGVYVGTEWASPKLLADTLGHCLHASALLRQAADLVGAHGLTFVLIAANECVLVLLQELFVVRRRIPSPPRFSEGERWSTRRLAAPASCLVLLVAGLAAYGGVRLWQLHRRHAGDRVTVALIQANIAHYDQLKAEVGTFDALRHILDAHFSLSAEAVRRDRPDLLVWPETMYPTTFGTPKSADGAAFDRAIAAFVNDVHVPLVFGAYDVQDSDEFNAAILLEPNATGGVVFDTYRKTRLFPFTEYLPWPLNSDRVRRWLPWAGTWKPGNGPQILPVTLDGRRSLRIAPLICYDAVDPSFAVAAVRQGAELLVTLSNDSWFAYPGVQRLILIVSAFRSIETRRPQVRSTPTGVSAVIDETGALLETIDVNRRGALVGTVRPMHHAWTLMLAWGDWFPPTALGVSLTLLFAAYSRRPLSALIRGTT